MQEVPQVFWCSMASRDRKDDVTDPSSHTSHSCLNSEEMKERLSRLQKQKRKLSVRVTQLEERLAAAREQDGVTLTEELHSDMKKIASSCTKQVHSAYPEGSFQRLFWDQQIQASSHSNPKSMKWHPIFIKWSLYLKYLSGKSYELLRKSGCIKLPSQSTLRDYTHHIPSKTGFSTENDQQFVDAAFLSEKLNKYVLLVMDEMHIKHDLVYDKHSGSLIGFVDLGNTNNQIMEFEKALSAEKTDRELASTMLVFMVRGLLCKFNHPYVQFACNDVSGSQMFDPMWEAVSRLERLGFCVLGFSCDGASPNRRLWKLHNTHDELIYKVPSKCVCRDFYFISDPPHLLKTMRNSFCSPKRRLRYG